MIRFLQKLYGHVDLFRNANPHDSPHDTFFSVNINQPFMNPHFPSVPCRRSFPAGRLQDRYSQTFCRQRNGSVNFDTCLLGYDFQFVTYFFKLRIVCACQAYPRFSNHRPSFLSPFAQTDLSGVYLRQETANKNLSNKKHGTNMTRAGKNHEEQ